MRRLPERGRRSVDRGTCGLGTELRKRIPRCGRRGRKRNATRGGASARVPTRPRGVKDPRHVRKLSLREPRDPVVACEMDAGGDLEAHVEAKLIMESHRKSDRVVVPEKRPNNAQGRAAEVVEERTLTEGNTDESGGTQTRSWKLVPMPGLDRVREAARRNRKMQFTALLHHVDEAALLRAFRTINRDATAGADGVTWKQYEERVEEKLRDLCGRIHRGSYRPQPSRRTYIPKADGTARALGIAALEDK